MVNTITLEEHRGSKSTRNTRFERRNFPNESLGQEMHFHLQEGTRENVRKYRPKLRTTKPRLKCTGSNNIMYMSFCKLEFDKFFLYSSYTAYQEASVF